MTSEKRPYLASEKRPVRDTETWPVLSHATLSIFLSPSLSLFSSLLIPLPESESLFLSFGFDSGGSGFLSESLDRPGSQSLTYPDLHWQAEIPVLKGCQCVAVTVHPP